MKYIVYDTEDEMIFDKVENYIPKPGDRILGEFDTPEQAAKIFDDHGFWSEFDMAVAIVKEVIEELG